MNTKEQALAAMALIDADIAKGAALISETEAKIKLWERKKAAWLVIAEDEPGFELAQPPNQEVTPLPNASDSFGAKVKWAIRDLGNREFTIPDIERKLNESGLMPAITQPRVRISSEMNLLRQKGMVEKTFAPETGVVPHRYRATAVFP